MNRIYTFVLILAVTISAFSLDDTVISPASPGDLDITFSGDGRVTDIFPGSSGAGGNAVAIQSDQKILVAGSRLSSGRFDFAVIRYNTDGSLDSSFGTGGRTATQVGIGSSEAYAVAVQSDGKIVVAGEAEGNIGIVRYNPNGSLDTTFDTDGRVETQGGIATSMAIQVDGKIVVAGYGEGTGNADFVAARYNPDGSLDSSFDGDGIARTPVGTGDDEAYGVTIQPNSKIVVAGWGVNGFRDDFAVVRYNTNGSLDTSFDGDGKVLTQIGSAVSSLGFAVTIQLDSRIIVAGAAFLSAGYDFAMVRYNMDGSRDTSFGSNGEVVTRVEVNQDFAQGVAVQFDGRILAAGYGFNGTQTNFAVVRYEPNGARDITYAVNGIRRIDFDGGEDRCFGMAIDNVGRTLVAGESSGRFALARLLGDSLAPASNFSVSGRVVRANGNGIPNVFVTITDLAGQSRTVSTNPFGYYKFEDVISDSTYTVSVRSKRYNFATSSRTVTVQGDVTDVDFVSVE